VKRTDGQVQHDAVAEEIKARFASDPKTADHDIAKRIIDIVVAF